MEAKWCGGVYTKWIYININKIGTRGWDTAAETKDIQWDELALAGLDGVGYSYYYVYGKTKRSRTNKHLFILIFIKFFYINIYYELTMMKYIYK